MDLNWITPPVARKYSVLDEIVDIFTQAYKVFIHDEGVAETDFEYTFETSKGFRSGFGKPCAPPAACCLKTSQESVSGSNKRPSFLDYALSFLEQLAGAIDRRQTQDCHSVASKGFQAVLEI